MDTDTGSRPRTWRVLVAALEAGVITAVVLAIMFGLVLRSDAWIWRTLIGAAVGLIGGGIGGYLYGGRTAGEGS